jgi:hypothetical protein
MKKVALAIIILSLPYQLQGMGKNNLNGAIKLKNGKLIEKALMCKTLGKLTALFNNDYESFYYLVRKCRNLEKKRYKKYFDLPEKILNILKALSLYPMDKDVREIVISTINGKGFEMKIKDPFDQESFK